MAYLFLSFLTAFGITYLSIPVIINIANEKKLVDVPDERKIHDNPIPALGGVGIFAGFIIAALLFWTNQFRNNNPDFNLQYIAAACLIIFFLGLKDDILDISALKKFIGQLIAAWILVYKCRLQINSFYGVFGIYELPNTVSLLITYLTVVLIVNSFNLIDGVDGLSSCLALVSLIGFSIFFKNYGTKELGYSILAAALAGSLVAFLIFNFHPAKIFMGDTGSLLVGLINAMLLIKFLDVNAKSDYITSIWKLKGGVTVGLSFIFIPLIDTIRVFGWRIINGNSPFNPDRNHIHHILLDKGFSHKKVTIILTLAALVLIVIAYISNFFLVPTASILVLLFSGVVLFIIANYNKPKNLSTQINNEVTDDARIVNITRENSAV